MTNADRDGGLGSAGLALACAGLTGGKEYYFCGKYEIF